MEIYNLKEEVYIMIVYFLYGVLIISSLDVINLFKSKKITRLIKNVIITVLIIILTYQLIGRIFNGYISIYNIFSFIGGALLYMFLIRSKFIKIIVYIENTFFKKIKKLLFPFDLTNALKKLFSRYIKHFKKKDKGNQAKD